MNISVPISLEDILGLRSPAIRLADTQPQTPRGSASFACQTAPVPSQLNR
ncbi:hypothetical protein CKA32_002769 [Geitlerinema sp. FC II]|nr:hypothetical protein CKA32_000586 [Geitlerinema sp. FC II]PPT10247.1 hypothetical protein CKA32_002769 [Geitlerinema sp. FC II]